MRSRNVAIGYAALTRVILLLASTPALRPWFLVPPILAPLLGPPAVLAVAPAEVAGWATFAVGTALCALALSASVRWPDERVAAWTALAILWLASGCCRSRSSSDRGTSSRRRGRS